MKNIFYKPEYSIHNRKGGFCANFSNKKIFLEVLDDSFVVCFDEIASLVGFARSLLFSRAFLDL